MSNQENILMMDGNGVMKNSNGNVIAKGVMIKSELLLSTPSIEDLVKRIESLEKQLADMQKATSCDGDHMRLILNHMTKMNDAFSTKS
ncbi:hypothetical protein PPO02_06770 [Proteus mirabilis]|uniref:hypothetical protein n=1 Tax=Proteus mirabilis TaxID=584 RepID=UPI00234A0657|nr:hypothetical protein [Proteus mirabilis]MDC5894416.1 hypothetical protein [Proteus mirabilis]MDC5915550.1 hypothetical protein [Proteus mirabilis]MDC5926066.1 hypothetical protein [Proteus mirabilis]MDC6011052.1 hypothetical protein [Proteus mirabilis]MDC6021625.1 hypothetical protein [Proteus mirabilis]